MIRRSAVQYQEDSLIRQGLATSLKETTKLSLVNGFPLFKMQIASLWLNDGQIDAIGRHEELLATNAIYQEVYEMQTQGKGEADEN